MTFRTVLRASVCAVLTLGFVGSALAQTVVAMPNWVQASPATSPGVRAYSAITYDAATGQVVLFGGQNNSVSLNDTWTYNGTTWTQQSPATSPPARIDATMAYDTATGQVVLFGGDGDSGRLNDTWTYNGTTWTQQSPGTSPAARYNAAMAYDVATGQVVLFGGYGSSGSTNDTWTYDGTTWTQQSPATSPPLRSDSTMAYDAATGQVVLFGGFGSSGSLNDTWTYDGTTWTQQSPATSPGARYYSKMAYYAATGQVVLFGGHDNSGSLSDTWTYNGTTWTQQSLPTSPAARYYSAMAYDAATGQIVLFGGYGNSGYLNDTWDYGTQSSFGTVAVGSSSTVTYTFNVTASGTLGTPVVVTQGVAGKDFQLGTGSTCTGVVTAGNTCTVVVNFSPLYPGVRNGAVEVVNSSGTVLATTLVSGIGSGAEVSFSPGTIASVAGSAGTCAGGTGTICGDGGAATSATLNAPADVVVDAAGNMYFSDRGDNRVRKVSAAGVISTYAGTGAICPNPTAASGACGDGSAATSATFYAPTGLALDGAGNLYITDYSDSRIRKVTAATGNISTVAGTGSICSNTTATSGACGDGGAATSATFNQPTGVGVDGAGNVYVTDTADYRVRMISASTGLISTIAGNGTACSNPTATTNPCGDGLTTGVNNTEANLPGGIVVDANDNVYFADGYNRLRMISAVSGVLSTVAGNGTACTTSSTTGCGDGGVAANTPGVTVSPTGVDIDAAGNLYITDNSDYRTRKVTVATGKISTIVGVGIACQGLTYPCGESLSATDLSMKLGGANFSKLDALGNLYIADYTYNRIRKVTSSAFPVSLKYNASGTAPATTTLTMNSIGTLPLTFGASTNPTISSPFVLASGTGSCYALAGTTDTVGDSCTDTISFTAPAAGTTYTGSLTTVDNAPDTPQVIALTGIESSNTLSFSQLPNGSETTNPTPPTANTITPGTSAGVITATVLNSSGANANSTDILQLVVQRTLSGTTTTVGTYQTNVTNGFVTPTLSAGVTTFDLSSVAQYAPGATAIYTYTLTDLTASTAAVNAYVNVGPTSASGTTARVMLVTLTTAAADATTTNWAGECPDQNVASPVAATNGGCTLGDALSLSQSNTTYAGSTIIFSSAINGAANTIYAGTALSATASQIQYNLTVSGNGPSNTFISGATSASPTIAANSLFHGKSAALTTVINVYGMTLEYGTGANGVALYVYGPTNVNNVAFLNNKGTGGGGALYANSSNTSAVAVTNSSFTGNSTTSTAGGGAIDEAGTTASSLTITNSTFTSNSASLGPGGAVVVPTTGSFTIAGSTFTSNSTSATGATGAGGAVSFSGAAAGTLMVTGSTFGSNTATGVGGAISVTTPVNTTIGTSTFISNTATSGGAVSVGATGEITTITNSTFTSNLSNAGSGGAIVAGGAAAAILTVTGSTFTTNTSSSNAGAISTGTAGTVNLSGDLFNSNTTATDGAGVFIASTSQSNTVTATLVNDTFTANVAGNNGGALYVSSGSATGKTTAATLEYLTIVSNTATGGDGGGIYSNTNGTLAMYNSVVGANNSAAGKNPDMDYNPSTRVIAGSVFNGLSQTTGVSAISLSSLGLSALGSYGGPTQVMIPLPGSQLLKNTTLTNAGGPTQTGALPITTTYPVNPGTAVTTDQRGFPRNGTGTTAGLVDVGAVESNLVLAFTSTVPVGAMVGQAFVPNPTVVLTETGVAVQGSAVKMTVSSGTLSGTTSVTTDATGTSTFTNLYATTPRTGVTLTATATTGGSGPASTATLGTFDVTTSVSQLVYTTAPTASLAVGGHSGNVVVTLENSSNATVTGDGSTITLTVTGPSGYTATYTKAAVSGVATFTAVASVALNTAGAYTYTATYPTGQFPVVAAENVYVPASQLVVSGVPSHASSGVAYTVTVMAEDASGNVTTSYTGTVHFTSSDAGATLPANYTFVSGDAGVKTFSVTFATAGTQSLMATDTVTTTITGGETGIVVTTNNVWVLNQTGTLVELNEAGLGGGAVGNTFGSGGLFGGVAYDSTGGIWSVVADDQELHYMSKSGTGAALYGTTTATRGGVNKPVSIAVDGLGYVWIANGAGQSVSEFTNGGVAVSGTNGYGSSVIAVTNSAPLSMALDNAGGVWVVSSGAGVGPSFVTHILGAAAPVVTPLVTNVVNTTTGTEP